MNASEHFREAEACIEAAKSSIRDYAAADVGSAQEQSYLAQSRWAQQQAQVHATLALAAAQIAANRTYSYSEVRHG